MDEMLSSPSTSELVTHGSDLRFHPGDRKEWNGMALGRVLNGGYHFEECSYEELLEEKPDDSDGIEQERIWSDAEALPIDEDCMLLPIGLSTSVL